jgi:peptidoglycan/LPS O-acetylase OafA/YrhL
MSDFYPAFSSTCFVVLTLWLMMVQQRYQDWGGDRQMMWRAFAIGLYFSLPGFMSLIALVDPTSPLLWEWTYTLVALSGAAVMAMLFKLDRYRLTTAAYPAAFVLYLAIGVLAIVALNQHPAHTENRVDQVLLCVLLFLGVNMAWLLFMSSHGKADAAGNTRGTAAGTAAAGTD